MKSNLARTSWMLSALAATLLLSAGCQSPQTPPGTASSTGPVTDAAKPNFGPTIQDVRTEATIQAMEQEYNAAKNSPRTHQYEAELEAAKKAQAKQEQEAEAAKAAAVKEPEIKP